MKIAHMKSGCIIDYNIIGSKNNKSLSKEATEEERLYINWTKSAWTYDAAYIYPHLSPCVSCIWRDEHSDVGAAKSRAGVAWRFRLNTLGGDTRQTAVSVRDEKSATKKKKIYLWF